MPIFIYNSLTKKKEEFLPLHPPQVNIYTCGVTVYDECHIGHARSLYIFGVIRGYLQKRGYQVKFVRNITDIDDKIINRARESGKGWDEVADKYIASYYEDIKRLGIARADCEPKATENIPDMVKHIEGLIKGGYAYEAGGDVYFNVRSFKDYGKLSGQSIDQMISGVRIDPGENKKDALDFALWKKSKEGEPSWDSPWGKGRPGWHIECSVMSAKFLGIKTLDIHAGGRDLIFPHHENEIAQAETLTGKQFARYWIHHGLLTINGQKMAKSLGNFITIKDFLSKYNPDILKLFFLSAHYSHPIDYTEEKIEAAGKQLKSLQDFFGRVEQLSAGKKAGRESGTLKDELGGIENNFLSAMDDDFNMPQALGWVFELLNKGNQCIAKGAIADSVHIRTKLIELLKVFGIQVRIEGGADLPASLNAEASSDVKLQESVDQKIQERKEARENKDFKRADEIRKELEEMGIILEDTSSGTIWRKK
jgi:cysteinyl-tRNA synthetase